MAKRGKKNMPASLKILTGNRGKRPIQNEPKPTPKAPPCPNWLPSYAKRTWHKLAPELERLGLLTLVDGPAFALLCTHYAIAKEAVELLKKEGILEADPAHLAADGSVPKRKHPAHQLLRDNSATFRKYLSEFGLSPAARAGLNIAEEEEDELAQFLKMEKR